VLYLAVDRPAQIARSMRRMFAERNRRDLENRIAVWRGQLRLNLVAQPFELAKWAKTVNAGTVVIDSLSDLATPLSSDEVGAAVKTALTALTEEGIEVAALHHQRKSNSENRKPTRLDDVYGSRWITAGAGSVVLLWGEPGDPVVELSHLKQPADEVGPLELVHDHDAGRTTVLTRPDFQEVVCRATRGGITVREAAIEVYGPNPTKAQEVKARRRLQRLVDGGEAVAVGAGTPDDATRYRPAAKEHGRGRVLGRSAPRSTGAEAEQGGTNPDEHSERRRNTPGTAALQAASLPLKGGGGPTGVLGRGEEDEGIADLAELLVERNADLRGAA
jgi:hypothetical protein